MKTRLVRLAIGLAGGHALFVISAVLFAIADSWFLIQWLEILDPTVVWHHQDIALTLYEVLAIFSSSPSLHFIASLSTAVYLLSFLVIGAAQWFVVGYLLELLWRRVAGSSTQALRLVAWCSATAFIVESMRFSCYHPTTFPGFP